VGVTPKLKDAIFERLESHFGVQLPTDPGLDTLGCIDQAAAGALRLGFCLGGNLYGSNPDAAFAANALSKLDTIVYLNTSLNTGHAHGLARQTIILPMLARDEEPEPTTQESMFNYIRMSDGGLRRHEGPRSEVEVIATLAERVLNDRVARPETAKGVGPIDWPSMRRTGKIREAIAQVVPGFEKMGEIDRTKQEFQIDGRTLHIPTFATSTGRARLHVHELPDLLGGNPGAPGLRLMTVRSEGQFNTVVYEEEDYYRDQDRRDVILLHPDDLARLGLAADQRVTVRSGAGSMTGIFARPFTRIKPGNALMYYPEANILVPRHADPQSRTPAFKSVAITIEPIQ
jgi:anaerobic selenocysteine-containing dehydrogenase